MPVSFCRGFSLELHTNLSQAIQGKDCLVQKFRNSSVMLEAPHYRPKVSHLLLHQKSG
jgi:hypothetical protein